MIILFIRVHDRSAVSDGAGLTKLSALRKTRVETCVQALSQCSCFGGYGGTETPPLPLLPPPSRPSRGSMVEKERGRACGSGCGVFSGRRATERLRRLGEENSM